MTHRQYRHSTAALLAVAGLVLLALHGCAGDGSSLIDDMVDPPDMGEAPTLAQVQAEIFGVICIECHVPGGPGPMPLDSEEVSFQNLVNVQSIEIGTLLRVEPGNAENSYILHKVEGRPSIVGQRMPPPPRVSLTTEQIDLIRDWIDAGAER